MKQQITDEIRINFLRDKLEHNAHYAVKAMYRIFSENQTEHEQDTEETTEDNGIGFTGTDAKLLSSFSKQVERKRRANPKAPWGCLLSVRQMPIVFYKMPKYARQVLIRFVKTNPDDLKKLDEKILQAI